MHTFIKLMTLFSSMKKAHAFQGIRFRFENGLATISYDEGPSEYTYSLAERTCYYQIPLTFHFQPSKVDGDIVSFAINYGHTVGIYYEELTEDIIDVKEFIDQQRETFIKKTGLVPILARLPDSYSDDHIKYCTELGQIVTVPNLDSNDFEMPTYFTESLYKKILSSDPSNVSLSICLRDRFYNSVNCIEELIDTLEYAGYCVVDMSVFLNIEEIEMEKDFDDHKDKDNDQKENITEEEIIKTQEEKRNETENIKKADATKESENNKNVKNKVFEKTDSIKNPNSNVTNKPNLSKIKNVNLKERRNVNGERNTEIKMSSINDDILDKQLNNDLSKEINSCDSLDNLKNILYSIGLIILTYNIE